MPKGTPFTNRIVKGQRDHVRRNEPCDIVESKETVHREIIGTTRVEVAKATQQQVSEVVLRKAK